MMHDGGSPLRSDLRLDPCPIPGREIEVVLLALWHMPFKSTILVFDEKTFRNGTETEKVVSRAGLLFVITTTLL